jgi:hypothetical protein
VRLESFTAGSDTTSSVLRSLKMNISGFKCLPYEDSVDSTLDADKCPTSSTKVKFREKICKWGS